MPNQAVKQTLAKEDGLARLRISARVRNALVFFLALSLLTIGAFLTYQTVFRLVEAQHWVTHSRDVQSALASIETVSSRAGRSRVEYIESDDPIRLNDYHDAVSETWKAIARVRQLSADNGRQQNNCSRLEALARRRIDLMDQSIELKQQGRASLENEARITQSVVRAAGEMGAQVLQMRQMEDELLSEREIRSQALFRREVILITAAFLIAILLLSLHYYLLNHELKGRQRAEESLRRLNVRLLEMQDSERRRISRELHESIGQYLSGVKMSLEVVRKSIPQNALLAECVTILDKSIAETRTISQLLHPPMLDDVGFASAARWYVDGFSERSGIRVDLTLPENLGRLPAAVELTLFRVLQESLTNVRWHARSPNAEVTVRLLADSVEMKVKDYGKGMSKGVLERFESDSGDLGLGMSGMRERIRELGGRLEVESDSSGTLIVATLPASGSVGEPSENESRVTQG
jgi:signal transduction histidine kinase